MVEIGTVDQGFKLTKAKRIEIKKRQTTIALILFKS